MPAKIFLDTCSIIALSGLDESIFEQLRSLLKEKDSGLYASHIQGDEMYPKNPPNFRQIQEKAYQKFAEHGIKIHWEEPTKGAVLGTSRLGYCRVMGESSSRVYDELRDELKKCMDSKGKYKERPFDDKAKLNNARDCLIAITSTDYDYFITSDDCLYRSLKKVLENKESKAILGKVANILYVRPDPKSIFILIESLKPYC